MRKLYTFGPLRQVNGSFQISSPPGARCSQKTIFQASACFCRKADSSHICLTVPDRSDDGVQFRDVFCEHGAEYRADDIYDLLFFAAKLPLGFCRWSVGT